MSLCLPIRPIGHFRPGVVCQLSFPAQYDTISCVRLTGRKFAWILTIAIAAAFLAVWFRNRQAETREASEAFEWFNALGFPDVAGRSWINVGTAQWSQSGGKPPQKRYVKGFLLATNGLTFTVFTMNLSIQTMSNTPSGSPERDRVGFEVIDLEREVAARLRKLRSPPEKSYVSTFLDRPLVSEQAEMFALGWACWRNGLNAEARSLYQEAILLPRKQTHRSKTTTVRERAAELLGRLREQVQSLISGKGVNESAAFREALEKNVANVLMSQATDAFADPSFSRAQLLGKFHAISTNYPHSEHHDVAVYTAKILARMLSEETLRSNVNSGFSAQLPMERQVDELIYQLRDQHGYAYETWNLAGDRDGNTNTPAHRLIGLGYVAVPRLIAALDSDALTRTVQYGRFMSLPKVLTVGDYSAWILERVTGFSFFLDQSNNSHMVKTGTTSPARAAAETWWAEFLEKGEEKMLAEAVASPGTDARAQAGLLRERYPDNAAACIIAGVMAATNSGVRASLLEELAKIEKPAVGEFLKRELTQGPALECRLAAARALLSHERAAALDAMLREWDAFSQPTDDNELITDELIDFLAKRDSVEVLEALTKNLRQRPVGVRFKVIEAVGDTNNWDFDTPDEQASPATVESIENILVQALEDNTERAATSGSWGDISFSHPYISDIAGYFLNERWPDRYTFDLSATSKTRERQRIVCINTWRQAHGLALVPLPEKSTVRLSPRDATRVTLVAWSFDSVALPPALVAQFNELKNKSLRPESVVRLLANFAGQPATNAIGLEVDATRDDDFTGVQLTVTLLPGTPPAQVEDWDGNSYVRLAGKTLLDQSESRALSSFATPDGWEDFAKALKQALASPPKAPFEFSVRLKADIEQ